jgi:hydrogenase nickel incorporation protein HypB
VCAICGCSGAADAAVHGHVHTHADGTTHSHPHPHSHGHEHEHGHEDVHAHDHAHRHDDGTVRDYEHEHAHVHGLHEHAPVAGGAIAATAGPSRSRLIQVERDLLEANDRVAQQNRARFARHRVLALNLVSSPGSGKTTLLVRTLRELRGRCALAVVEGDQATDNDAARVRETGVPALQVNTGKGCHLDARQIERSLESLPMPEGGVLFIENVGNLVCPAGFDLGEAHKVVLASVTEGEDKPLKYPNMFAAADLVLVSKIDLLPYLRFDVQALIANARRVNPRVDVLQVSAETGQGFDAWLAWIEARGARGDRSIFRSEK